MFCDVYKYSVVNTICRNFEFHMKASSFLAGNVQRRLKDCFMDMVYFVGWIVGWLVCLLVSWLVCLLVSWFVCLLVSWLVFWFFLCWLIFFVSSAG